MKKILINDAPWQTRLAITWNEELQNLYFASHAEITLERAFFKGIVTKVLPGIQTAFVDIGQEKAGFLHISEIDREMAIKKISKTAQLDEQEAPKPVPRKKPDISKILKEGDPILVQVSKEPVYEKGAKLTTCFTLPGRFIVLMPNIPRIGISKKIEDREERVRLKDAIKDKLPEGMGAIIRTTAESRDTKELIKEVNFLVRTWKTIQTKFASSKPKAKLYEDLALPLQIVRDHLDDDVEAVITDNKKNQTNIYKFVKIIAPEYSHKIKLYEGTINIFEFYGIEKQIEQALAKKVGLKSGGSLIIETTEAMTVIDVNTGRFTGKTNLEDTILKTNLEAAEEVARQLRLRNIGGLIVIDFIDMAAPANRQKLFKFFEKILREHDKFQSVVLKVSEFGLVQMTRKRSGKTLLQQLTHNCSICHGLGFVKSTQTEAYAILRRIVQELIGLKRRATVTLSVHPTIFEYITNNEYDAVLYLEKECHVKITLLSDKKLAINEYKFDKK
jgi:ribonuclease G